VLLAGAGIARDVEHGAALIAAAIADGRAVERFGAMVAAQGGPVRFVQDWRRFLPEATVLREVRAQEAGVVQAIEGEALGLAVVALGGGRVRESDRVDPAVGLSGVVRLGARVEIGQPLAMVHAARSEQADAAVAAVRAAITVGDAVPRVPDLVVEHVA
jgi:thymidine phosphorylase